MTACGVGFFYMFIFIGRFIFLINITYTSYISKKEHLISQMLLMESGDVLLSRAVSSQVPSALKGLTSVFGMGTGGTPSPLPPEIVTISLSFTGCCSTAIPFELPSAA